MSGQTKKKKKRGWAEIKRQFANTPNKDKLFGGICVACAIGLTIWFIIYLIA